jgi:vacuolar-type H+-ATPase subunit H
MKHLRMSVLALLASGLLAGCGDEVGQVNDAIDGAQERVDEAQRDADRIKDAAEDPVGTARDEADRALEDAVTPEDQP